VDGLRNAGSLPSATTNVREVLRDPSLAALTSLALMPLVLIGVSVVLQPSLLDRYAIVTVLFWAPLVALAVATLGQAARRALVLCFALLVVLGVQRTIAERQDFANGVAANAAAYDLAKRTNLPIVFPSILAMYPVAGLQRDQSARFLDLPDSTIRFLFPQERLEWLRRHFRLERNIARGHSRAYGFPRLATQAELDSTPRFLLLATDLSLPGGYKNATAFGRALFPGFRVTRLNQYLALFERVRSSQ
jgi:hypothetical protein